MEQRVQHSGDDCSTRGSLLRREAQTAFFRYGVFWRWNLQQLMMAIPKITALALFGMVLASCAPPKPQMVFRDDVLLPKTKSAAPSVTPTQADAVAASNSSKPGVSGKPAVASKPAAAGEDGVRLPDMVTMPGEGDFRKTQPKKPESGSGGVIARPPKE